MKKAILLFALILSAMNMMAQAYEFESSEKTGTDGEHVFVCELKRSVEIGTLSPDITIEVWDLRKEFFPCQLNLRLSKVDKGSDVTKSIQKIAEKFGFASNMETPVKITLSNGDLLSAEDGCYLQLSSFDLLNNSLGVGVINVVANTSFLISTYYIKKRNTTENQKIICQQLRTYDIVKIEVDGVSFDVRGLRSAATFDAMFDALAAKTGKGHLYRNSGTSSSSSRVSSGPSATCELGFVAVYSWGDIDCRVDNLQISGAKGKDVRVAAIFEDVTEEYVNYGFLKRFTSIQYDDCTYDEFRIKGKVNELAKLNRYNRGRFKVYIEVEVDNQIIYTSNPKYVTIYNDQGSWRRN